MNVLDDKQHASYKVIWAAYENNLKEIDVALEENSLGITFQEASVGLTALHIAAGNGNYRMVIHLLSKAGIDLRIVDYFGRNPLDMAIDISHDGIIDALSRKMYPKNFQEAPPLCATELGL